ncbi:hypothetical protein ATO3_12085 [Marinibacterium profundimaris]|uniref:histidine kinase n=1 Tax=Marinibacterium profundimaris TaxID=1679460 RepID=A0A225NMM0_9RHOB|nr:hypothetical protein ATO3_12085 [Marinibacterium profundimaris]
MLAALLLALLADVPGARAQADPPERRRFLFLYANQSTLPANLETTRGLEERLRAALGSSYEVYAEYRDIQRFPGPLEDARFRQRLEDRYSDFHLDAILALGRNGLQVALEQHDMLGPDVPVIYGGFSARHLGDLDLPPGFHGFTNEYDARGTVELARALQPDARRLVVFAGNGPQDELWKSYSNDQLSDLDGIEYELVTDLTLDGFVDRAAALPPDTILLVLTIFKDADGTDYAPLHAAGVIAEAASVPTYGVYETFIGGGITGGEVDTFEDLGMAMGETALRLLDGQSVPAHAVAPSRRVVDWRQLERFDIDPERVPPGTEIRYYTPTLWEEFAPQILLATAIILAQSGTIAALVIQNRRRRETEAEMTRQRLEMAHLARVAQLGELSGALAHELNQPLTSILANAEAGSRLIARAAPDLDEISEIFGDIAAEDRRAAAIITDLRRLMSKGDSIFEPLELNTVIRATLALAATEIARRDLRVDLQLSRDPIAINGNRGQLQQVVLNLLINAAEAMSEFREGRARVILSTGARDDGMVGLVLRDFGPGLDAGVDPFRPFATTKSSGMGLGLPICRTIAEAHGGRLTLEPAEGGGTRAIFALPRA